MTNPVAVERVVRFYSPPGAATPGDRICREVQLWCPGCKSVHHVTVELFEGAERAKRSVVWDWNGDLVAPTFSPSLLCFYTVHTCPPDYEHYEVCTDREACGQTVHAILNARPAPGAAGSRLPDDESTWIYGHPHPHVTEPPYGNCHSFIRDGRWEFLGDSGHHLAGKTVDLVPLPDWLIPDKENT